MKYDFYDFLVTIFKRWSYWAEKKRNAAYDEWVCRISEETTDKEQK